MYSDKGGTPYQAGKCCNQKRCQLIHLLKSLNLAIEQLTFYVFKGQTIALQGKVEFRNG